MADRARAYDALVTSVVARARIASTRRRRGLDRELRDHLEDLEAHLRAGGCSDAELAIQVRRRFGDAAAVGDALAQVYARDRALACAGWSTLQLAGSFLIAALVIASFQALAAVATHARLGGAFSHWRGEMIGFAALACGYVGTGLVARATVAIRTPSRIVIGAAVVAAVAACAVAVVPGHVVTPAIASVCAGAVRLLERVWAKYAAFLGTAIPFTIAWAVLGPLIPGAGDLRTPVLLLVVVSDLTVACLGMRWLAARVERRMPARLEPHAGAVSP